MAEARAVEFSDGFNDASADPKAVLKILLFVGAAGLLLGGGRAAVMRIRRPRTRPSRGRAFHGLGCGCTTGVTR